MVIDGTMIWGVGVSLFLLIVGHFLRVRTTEAAMDREHSKQLADRVLIVETKMIEEKRVREIINECISDVKEGQVEIRNDIKGLSNEIHELAQLMVSHNVSG